MSEESDDLGHGHSPAAWTAVIWMLVAFAAGTLFFWFDIPIGVWISAAFVVLGAVVGKVMQKAGYGVGGVKTVARAHD